MHNEYPILQKQNKDEITMPYNAITRRKVRNESRREGPKIMLRI